MADLQVNSIADYASTGAPSFPNGAKTDTVKSTGGTTYLAWNAGVPQIYLGGTAAANLFSDYEIGTFTPTISGSPTYTLQYGSYTKKGDEVTVYIHILLSNNTAGTSVIISGLPFSTISTTNYSAIGSVSGDAMGAFDGSLSSALSNSDNSISISYIDTTGTSQPLQTKTSSARYFTTITYKTT